MAQSQLTGHMGFLPGGRLVAVDLINTVSYPRRRTLTPTPRPYAGSQNRPEFPQGTRFYIGAAGKYGTI